MAKLIKTYGDITVTRVHSDYWVARVPLSGEGYVQVASDTEEMAVLRLVQRLSEALRERDVSTVIHG